QSCAHAPRRCRADGAAVLRAGGAAAALAAKRLPAPRPFSRPRPHQRRCRPVATAPARSLTGAGAAPTPVSGQVGGALIQADSATNTLIIIGPDVVYRHLRAAIYQIAQSREQRLL